MNTSHSPMLNLLHCTKPSEVGWVSNGLTCRIDFHDFLALRARAVRNYCSVAALC